MRFNFAEFVKRYSIAIGSVAGVFALTMFLTNFIQADFSTLYLAAVMFAAWRGGMGAGLLAAFLSVAIASYFFLPPVYSFAVKTDGLVELIVFALAATLIGYLSAARERALALEQLARREAESANLVKDEFLAAVSHELRTPLTTIKTFTRLLLKKNLPEEQQREYLEDIASECERQIDFVHNLLDLSHIRAGGVQIDLGQVDAVEVLKACEKIERVNAAENNHQLVLEFDSDLPTICADQNALRRAICAITENAVKYTPEGGRIALRAQKNKTGHVVIEIADNGKGISQEDLPHVFERFYRGGANKNSKNTDAQKVTGIGLGLHLAHELVKGMNGTITVESKPEIGSTFRVLLPTWNETDYITESEDSFKQEENLNG